ncbi:PREDICTED: LOC109947889 [Prunus dulcis]|uniref:PREDICTED: LOC109947889 n=1 Tax=Prunus dulcis TaxID=3755 RepID=A0A5E4GEA8_PRUDU|nr:PREDICTED: LOC109947889 [Prunus dulcis]
MGFNSISSGSYRPRFQNPSHGPSPISHTPDRGFGPRVNNGRGYSPRFSSPSSGSKSHVIPECQICNKRGHTASTCYHRIPESGSSVPSIIECQICGKKGHSALD